jgi:hypothetical protein
VKIDNQTRRIAQSGGRVMPGRPGVLSG